MAAILVQFLTAADILDAAVARLQGIYLEAMQAWEASKSGTTVETNVAVDENNFVRSQTANRRVTRTSHGDPAFLYAAIRALKESMRAAVIIAARPPDTSLDRLLALNEEAFGRSIHATLPLIGIDHSPAQLSDYLERRREFLLSSSDLKT